MPVFTSAKLGSYPNCLATTIIRLKYKFMLVQSSFKYA